MFWVFLVKRLFLSQPNRLGAERKPLYAHPQPRGDAQAPWALIFDLLDPYKGHIVYRVVSGRFRGDMIKMMSNGKVFETAALGVISPYMTEVESLSAGEVGYLAAGIKNVSDTRVGDTITLASRPADRPLPGYKVVKPMVYCGLYPLENNDFE